MTTQYQIDTTHSSIEFSVRHLVIARVRGRFARFAGTIDLDEADVTRSRVRAEIDAASISTGDDKRDAHLRSPDFFDVDQHPQLTFESRAVEEAGDDLRVTGALTIHGVTRDVVLTVEALGGATDPWGNQRIAFSARATLDRREFGLRWNQVLEAGGFLVGDKIELTLDVQAVRASAQAAA